MCAIVYFSFQSDYCPSPGETRALRNYFEYDDWTEELIRNKTSSRNAAGEGNALLLGLLKNGGLSEEFEKRFDEIQFQATKIDNAKDRLRCRFVKEHNVTGVVCLGCDGKKEIKGYNLVFTDETDRKGGRGRYLTYTELPKEESGFILAREAYKVIKEYESEQTIIAIAIDNTTVNTGHKNGMVACLTSDVFVDKPLMMIGCSFHATELIFRNLFKQIDGKSSGPDTFTGPIGKLLHQDFQNQDPVNFVPIPDLFDITIPEQIVANLNHDQKLLYEYCVWITTGVRTGNFFKNKIGELSSVRWTTMATRCLALYSRMKVRKGKLRKNLVLIVKFILGVFAPTWFKIKKNPGLHNLPWIYFDTITSIRTLVPVRRRKKIFRTIQNFFFAFLSDNFLHSMLWSKEPEIQKLAIEAIQSARRTPPTAATHGHRLKIPEIDFKAKKWTQLISLTGAYEPLSTKHLTDEALELWHSDPAEHGILLAMLPSETQSVERSVKVVSSSTGKRQHVKSAEKGHADVLVTIDSREKRPEEPRKYHVYRN